jgi:hypothetical protein
VGDTITEHPAKTSEKTATSKSVYAQSAALRQDKDSDLLRVIAAWGDLSEEQRARILAIACELR